MWEKAVAKVPGVTSVTVSLLTNSMNVEGTAAPSDIIQAVTQAGYALLCRGESRIHPHRHLMRRH
ncbi:MAG: heavy metal-associated domain-containing protein [Eubacterium ramulus]